MLFRYFRFAHTCSQMLIGIRAMCFYCLVRNVVFKNRMMWKVDLGYENIDNPTMGTHEYAYCI